MPFPQESKHIRFEINDTSYIIVILIRLVKYWRLAGPLKSVVLRHCNVSECEHDQHYTHDQAVSPSCNHPNGDGWPALSTGRRDVE